MGKSIMLMEHFRLLKTSKKNLFNKEKENSVSKLGNLGSLEKEKKDA